MRKKVCLLYILPFVFFSCTQKNKQPNLSLKGWWKVLTDSTTLYEKGKIYYKYGWKNSVSNSSYYYFINDTTGLQYFGHVIKIKYHLKGDTLFLKYPAQIASNGDFIQDFSWKVKVEHPSANKMIFRETEIDEGVFADRTTTITNLERCAAIKIPPGPHKDPDPPMPRIKR